MTEYNLQDVERIILSAVTQQSDRDKQRSLGPSSVGSCLYCVGHIMAQSLPNPPQKRDDGFGYAAWIGTGVHFWMEHHLPERLKEAGFTAVPEARLEIGQISDYGLLTGSNDLYVEELRRTFDWKFPGKFTYDKIKLALKKRALAIRRGDEIDPATMLPSLQYRVQQQLYAHGQILAGNPVDYCVIVFFPRHSNDIEDVQFFEEPYNPKIVEVGFARTEAIWEDVKNGLLDELPSEDGCYTCERYGR